MNKERRKELEAIDALIATAKERLEMVRDAEQEALDNLPESLQQGERGQAMEEAIGNLESTISNLEDVASEIEGIINV
jgi:hypothetical protein